MARVFNPPPGWPKPAEGWTPPPGWKPDPNWPEPPKGWDFWTEKADDIGSSLFGGSALGSSLFESSDTTTDSYGSVSPSGGAAIPGAPEGPDFTASAPGNQPSSPSYGAQQSGDSTPHSPSYGQDQPGYTATPTEGPGGTTYTQGAQEPSTAPPARKQQGGGVTMLLGVAAIAAGGIFTGWSYYNAPPGGTYTVYFGPFIIGAILLIVGLVRLVQQAAAKRQSGIPGYVAGGTTQHTASGDSTSGFQTGQSSTLSTQNPTDPNNYKRP